MTNYKNYFGFEKEPFPQDIRIKDLYPLPGLEALLDRFLFAVKLSAATVITGDVGSGKSTSLRYACSKLHPSEFKIIPVIANTGTVLEMFRQIVLSLATEIKANSITKVTKVICSLPKGSHLL